MLLYADNKQNLFDISVTHKCPYCNTNSGMELVTIPDYTRMKRFQLKSSIFGFRCNSCNAAVAFLAQVEGGFYYHSSVANPISYYDHLHSIVPVTETYEHIEYLPQLVRDDFSEALNCYSVGAYNAFASMCRRSIQSLLSSLGAQGNDKVINQLRDLKGIDSVDEETYEILKQIIIVGHDGAHPHLPSINIDRAEILLELMKDIFYQLIVRKAKLIESSAKRKEVIEAKKGLK
jgi:hypothetical protein